MERRAVQRIKAEVVVACRVEGRSELAEIYDISTDGCMLQASIDFCEAGEDIELTFGGIILRGRVVWAKHRNAGVQFLNRASSDTIGTIIAANRPHCVVIASSAHRSANRLHLATYGTLALASILLLLR